MESNLMFLYLQALLLGFLEASTEFLPVSSTGHLLLAGHFMGFEGPPGKVFEIAIQMGAIMAICVLYFSKLWGVVIHLPSRSNAGTNARRFAGVILAAFLPAALVGVVAHDMLTTYLFNPIVVCTTLVMGGLIIVWLEGSTPPTARFTDVDEIDWKLALKIGAVQCMAMVPGVSRSGATILGAMWLGASRTAATEFSFFLALPTMAGAVAYSLYKQRSVLNLDDTLLIAVGLISAFIGALLVVRWLVSFVSRHTFKVFGYYRIIVGSLGLILLALGY
jgi:undecaprenyl-diphosphatase